MFITQCPVKFSTPGTHTHKHTHTLQLWNFCCKVKVESLLSRFLVIFLLQPLPVCVCVCVFVYFMQGKSFVKKRTRNFWLFAVDKPKVTSICISNFLAKTGQGRKTLEWPKAEILHIEDDIPWRCSRSTHKHTHREKDKLCGFEPQTSALSPFLSLSRVRSV